MIRDFLNFITKGNIIELAIAVIIANTFGQVINSLVSDIMMPVISLLIGEPDFSSLKIGSILIGKFVNALFIFLTVTLFIYFLVIVPLKKVNFLTDKTYK